MGITGIMSVGLILLVFLIRSIDDLRKKPLSIVLNVFIGGILFMLVNYLGFSIHLNAITGSIICMFGAPGIVFIALLKILFEIF